MNPMSNQQKSSRGPALSRAEAMHLQAIENNPLTEDQIAMLEMFDREGYSPEERIRHIAEQHAKLEPRAAE